MLDSFKTSKGLLFNKAASSNDQNSRNMLFQSNSIKCENFLQNKTPKKQIMLKGNIYPILSKFIFGSLIVDSYLAL